MGRRGKRKGSHGRAEARVRGRVRERVQGRPGRGEEGGAGRRRGTLNIGVIEGYANRLTDHVGGPSRLAGAASGLAGAASGLAGGSFAHRILESDKVSSEEDFKKEVREHLALLDERLQWLEDEMHTLREGEEDVQEPGGGPDPDSDQ